MDDPDIYSVTELSFTRRSLLKRSLSGVTVGATAGLAGCGALDRNRSYRHTGLEVAPLPDALTKEQYRQYVETELSEYAELAPWYPPSTPPVPLDSSFERAHRLSTPVREVNGTRILVQSEHVAVVFKSTSTTPNQHYLYLWSGARPVQTPNSILYDSTAVLLLSHSVLSGVSSKRILNWQPNTTYTSGQVALDLGGNAVNFPVNGGSVTGQFRERDDQYEFTWEGKVRVPQTLHSFLAVEGDGSEFDPTVSLVIGAGLS